MIRRGVRRSSELFYRFKTGEAALSFPLALGMHRALAKARRLDFDVIVPVPLSPDKAKRGENCIARWPFRKSWAVLCPSGWSRGSTSESRSLSTSSG